MASIIFLSSSSFAQKSTELGLFLGGATYFGEINRIREFYQPNPAIGIVARRSINPHYSYKIMLAGTQLSASDANFIKQSSYKQFRNSSMSNPLVDLIIQCEYNFYPITYSKDRDNFTPYVHLGLGTFAAIETNPMVQASIPFGAGIKFKLAKKLEIRLEYIFHKTFTDDLDKIPYETNSGDYKFRQLSQKNNKDNYSIYGISLLYTIKRQRMQCPVFDKQR